MTTYTLGQLSDASGVSRRKLKIIMSKMRDFDLQRGAKGSAEIDADEIPKLSAEIDRRRVAAGKLPVRTENRLLG